MLYCSFHWQRRTAREQKKTTANILSHRTCISFNLLFSFFSLTHLLSACRSVCLSVSLIKAYFPFFLLHFVKFCFILIHILPFV